MARKSEPPADLIVADPEIPDDFRRRLELFKEGTGLTWEGFAQCVGVAERQVQRWRRGCEPSGGSMMGLLKVAARRKGGLRLFLGELVPEEANVMTSGRPGSQSGRSKHTIPVSQMPLLPGRRTEKGEQPR